MDWASASRSLHQLCFRILYLTMGGGHVTGHDSEASDWTRGMTAIRGLAQWSFTAVMFYNKANLSLGTRGAYIWNHEQGT